jgi:RNA ligase (TIGR02306 family)
MRRLASIQKIEDLRPIEGADAIEMASVLGWEVVVKKGEFTVGDLCVYCEIDSILPKDNEHFAFLESKKWRIKTIRLRGQISQGICFPLSILPEVRSGLLLEDDVTEALSIVQYDPEVHSGHKALAGNAKGLFPSFIPKTDETRIQTCFKDLTEFLQRDLWVLREKLDGSSITFYMHGGQFGVCSRNLDLKLDESNDGNAFVAWAKKAHMEDLMRSCNMDEVAFQGELIGPGIQKNKYGLDKHIVRLFNVYDIKRGEYLNDSELTIRAGMLGLSLCPIITRGFSFKDMTVRDIVAMSSFKSILNESTLAEGFVARPEYEGRYRNGRVSFKAINPEFLLKHGE